MFSREMQRDTETAQEVNLRFPWQRIWRVVSPCNSVAVRRFRRNISSPPSLGSKSNLSWDFRHLLPVAWHTLQPWRWMRYVPPKQLERPYFSEISFNWWFLLAKDPKRVVVCACWRVGFRFPAMARDLAEGSAVVSVYARLCLYTSCRGGVRYRGQVRLVTSLHPFQNSWCRRKKLRVTEKSGRVTSLDLCSCCGLVSSKFIRISKQCLHYLWERV
jgi:hypothetical protein